VLAVPTSYILDETNIDSETRLSLTHSNMMKSDNFKKIVPSCTWSEIKKMSESKLVTIASHGHKHLRLAASSEDEIDSELISSKKSLIQKRVLIVIFSFIHVILTMKKY